MKLSNDIGTVINVVPNVDIDRNKKNHTFGVLSSYNQRWTSKFGSLMVTGGTNTPRKKRKFHKLVVGDAKIPFCTFCDIYICRTILVGILENHFLKFETLAF